MQAIVLAGGLGTRLRPVTYEIPKPLVPVKKKPILNHLMEFLTSAGVKVIKEAILFTPKQILVICGEAHSTSAYLIWKKIFPESKILVKCFPFKYEYQKDHPFKVSRSPYICFFANLARHALLLILGLEMLGKLKHRAN